MRCTLLILIALLASCGRNPGPACEQSPSLPPITPDYCNVTMPCNMALPSFMVEGATHIRAEVEFGGESMTLDGDDELCLDKIYSYHGLPGDVSAPLNITVSVWSESHHDGIRYAPFTITLSPDTIDRYLTYRLIPPGYEGWHAMGIYRRDLSTYEETPIVTIDRPGEGCVNCHVSSWGNPARTLYHRRGEGGGTQFSVDGHDRFVNLKETPACSPSPNLKLKTGRSPVKPKTPTLSALQGSYPAWHPSGRYVAFASTDTHQSFYHSSRDKIEVYDLGGRLFIYDVENNRQLHYPQFSDSTLWHTFPAFSPDGRTLYYCRARAVSMPHQADNLHYDLMSVSFDPETGELGEPTTIIAVSNNNSPSPVGEGRGGVSISFPRVSPDGRFLIYTVADCSTFPIWHKEADLGMIDLRTGEAIDISAINSDDVDSNNSYHAWSANSRWVVFSSRRIDGRYTRLFFAHIDEDGRVSKPFLLPQRSPLHNIMRMDSYNVPDLIESKE